MAKLLNYLASNPHAEIQDRASGFQLAINSDASYLSASQTKRYASGAHFLREGPPEPENPEDFVTTTNIILLVVCKITRNIMPSAAEAEYGIIFVNTQKDVPIRTTLSEMGWKQVPTAIKIDNYTAEIIATK